jgi:hypothetical protein
VVIDKRAPTDEIWDTVTASVSSQLVSRAGFVCLQGLLTLHPSKTAQTATAGGIDDGRRPLLTTRSSGRLSAMLVGFMIRRNTATAVYMQYKEEPDSSACMAWVGR